MLTQLGTELIMWSLTGRAKEEFPKVVFHDPIPNFERENEQERITP